MAAPLPTPIVHTRYLAPPAGLTWHVDLGWRPNQMVRGQGLDGQEVFTPETTPRLTWGRSSRNGISYQSHRYDFVVHGLPRSTSSPDPPCATYASPPGLRRKGGNTNSPRDPAQPGIEPTC